MILLRSRHFLVVVLLSSIVYGDYDCVCNYNVEKPVLPSADENAQPIGYMYEFDCKPKSSVQSPSGYYTIQFEKQLGYVSIDNQLKIQTCPGDPDRGDLIPAPTTAQPTTTTPVPTTTTTSTTPKPTTTSITTTTTTTPKPTTTSTTTTTTTTPRPTTTHTTTTTTTTPKPTTTHTTTTTTTTPKPTTTHTTTTTTTTPKPTTTHTTTTTTTTPKPSTTHTTTTTTTTPKPTTPTTTTQPPSTTPKHGWSLAANVSGTPYQYIGVGYNLLTENPDDGFHTTHQIFQFTGTTNNIHEATYVKRTSCEPHRITTLLHGSKAYQDELKTLVRPDPSHSSQLLKEAFKYNTQFTLMQQILDGQQSLYLDVLTTCNLGTVRYTTEKAFHGNYSVTREFARDVCALPTEMTPSNTLNYMHFLDKWGTSIVTSVDLGTKSLERYTTTQAEVVQHVQQTDTMLLEPRGPFEGFSSSVMINTHDFGSSHASQQAVGVLNKTSSFGMVHNQAPIGGEVIPITDALDMNYWRTILDQAVAEKVCSDSIYGTDLNSYKANIQDALNQYDGYKRNMYPNYDLLDRHTFQVPITWPYGTYGLMKATTGCPSNNVQWEDGWRRQDADLNGRNEYSPYIANYMSGDFSTHNMTTWFCMKTSAHSSAGGQYDQQWPKGSYCILKKNACPTGFSGGYIFWDDENGIFGSNVNAYGGTLPDGYYDVDTKVYYCCRNDGLPTFGILLPTDQPFILIRYSIRCQYVYGMSVDDLYIKWDDEKTGNTDIVGGMHPLDDGGSTDHRLHFCFYRRNEGAPSIIG